MNAAFLGILLLLTRARPYHRSALTYSCLWIPAVCPPWPVWAPWRCPSSLWRYIFPSHPCCGASGVNGLRDTHPAWTLCCSELWPRSVALLRCVEELEEVFSYSSEWTSLLVLDIIKGSGTNMGPYNYHIVSQWEKDFRIQKRNQNIQDTDITNQHLATCAPHLI